MLGGSEGEEGQHSIGIGSTTVVRLDLEKSTNFVVSYCSVVGLFSSWKTRLMDAANDLPAKSALAMMQFLTAIEAIL